MRQRGSPRLQFRWPAAFSLIIVLFFAGALWVGRNFDFKTGLFPWIVAIAVLALAVAQLIRDCLGKKDAPPAEDHPVEAEPELPAEVVNRRTAVIFGWIVGFFVTIWLLGFAIGGAVASFAQLKFGFKEKWPITIALTLLVWAFVYIFFEKILNTPFPPGKLFTWLNLVPAE